uniref:Adenylosuccinate synthetase n=2 Tax=Zeugodacus cucurbitae TaxID=28588 RepID=A0A0A1X8T4_ZEUCU
MRFSLTQKIMSEITEIEFIKSNESEIKVCTTIMPTHMNAMDFPRPGGALQQLADLAAAIAAEDRSGDSYSDFEESDMESDDSDYFSIDMPFRARRSSLPAVIEGQKVTEAAMKKLKTQRLARRSMYL